MTIRKACHRALLVLTCSTALLGAGTLSYAQNMPDRGFKIIERPDNEYLILGVIVNDNLREEGMEAYLPQDAGYQNVLIPLGALSRLLSVGINVEPHEGRADGFYLSEDRTFQLDLRNQSLIVDGQSTALRPDDAESHADDIYVQAEALRRWFGMNISLDLNSLFLDINTEQSFPFQDREARRKKAEAYKNRIATEIVSPENAYYLPYQGFSFPSLLLQQSAIATSNAGDKTYSGVTTAQGNMDLAKFNANFILSHHIDSQGRREITNSELYLEHRDPKRNMLGPMRAGRIALGDVDFPSVPLFTGKARGRGVNISSNSNLGFEYARDVEGFYLEGEAPVGWDAELYRNGIFFDFRTITSTGKFRFDNLDLINGFNMFQIVLYGPEGQKQTLTREVYRGPNMLKKGETFYDISAGQPQSDFVPLAENKRDNETLGFSAQGLYGVSDRLTLGASAFTGPTDSTDNSEHAATFTAASSFLGLNNQIQLMLSDNNRRAYDVMSRTRFKGTNISVQYTTYDGFDSADQPLKTRTELAFSRSFMWLNASLKAVKRNYLDTADDMLLENVLSAKVMDFNLVNTLEKTFSKTSSLEHFYGDLSVLKNFRDIRLRGTLLYDLSKDATDTIRSIRLTGQKNFNDRSSLRINADHQFSGKVTSGDVRYSRYFGPVSVDFNVSANTEDNYAVGVNLRTALQSDYKGHYKMVDSKTGGQAVLGVRAYADDNGNGHYDDGEEVLNKIAFKASRGGVEGITDEQGVAWMNGFIEQPTRIRIDKNSVQSIYLQPAKDSVDVIPRRGSNAIINFPFTRLGEIDGFVTAPDGQELGNIPVALYNVTTGEMVDEITSEYDGYFIFSALPLGEYRLRAYADWLDNPIESTKSVALSAQQTGALDQNLTLDLPPEEADTEILDQ